MNPTCPACDLPMAHVEEIYSFACADCHLIVSEEPGATWTTLGNPCATGHPTCNLGDGHAGDHWQVRA